MSLLIILLLILFLTIFYMEGIVSFKNHGNHWGFGIQYGKTDYKYHFWTTIVHDWYDIRSWFKYEHVSFSDYNREQGYSHWIVISIIHISCGLWHKDGLS